LVLELLGNADGEALMTGPYSRKRKLAEGDRVVMPHGDGVLWGSITSAKKVRGNWVWRITWDGHLRPSKPLFDGSVDMGGFADPQAGEHLVGIDLDDYPDPGKLT
jgi:hypothetical protein